MVSGATQAKLLLAVVVALSGIHRGEQGGTKNKVSLRVNPVDYCEIFSVVSFVLRLLIIPHVRCTASWIALPEARTCNIPV